MQQNNITLEQYGMEYGFYSMWNFQTSGWFLYPIMFICAVLCIYVFFIWYRDWLGKASFIYRLLMLPTQRLNVYFAKLTAIVLFVLTLIGAEIIVLELIEKGISGIVPEELYQSTSHMNIFFFEILQLLYPLTFGGFVKSYGLGITAVAIIFTAILFERSYRIKGIVFAIIYTTISSAVIISPYILDAITKGYFYPNELYWMNNITIAIVFAFAIWMANKLLNQKIDM